MAILDEIRARIVGLSERRKKGVEIAAIVGVPVRTVQRLVKEFRENGTYKSKTCSKKYGKKLSDRDVRGIKRVLQANRRITLSDITNMCPTKVCRNTIRKALHDSGIHSRIAVKNPFLTPRHMSQRLAFAQKYCRWSAEEWEQVIWTDESTFEVGKNSRQIHVWRIVNERYASSCIVPTFKSGRTSLMIWGAFSGGQKSELVFMPKDRRSAKDFVEVVYNKELLHFMAKVPQGLLMEDGARVHRSKLCEQ